MTSRVVLVTDGEQRAALAVVRSLGRAGHTVYVCSSRGRSLAGASRYCRRELRVSDALADPAVFRENVARLVRTLSVDVLLPVSEAAMHALLPVRRCLAPATLPFGEHEGFRRICDKRLVLEAAPQFGIAVPEQWTLCCRGALERVDPEALRYPLVIKPSRSICDDGGHRSQVVVAHAADRAQLETRLDAFGHGAYPILLQRRIRGPGVGVFLLLWQDRTVAVFSHRRIREKPPSGGVSVYRESIPADPTLVARSRALLEHFGWQGVAMVEYKIDAASGAPFLMEINGRFWGSLQLAVDAGVDFPALLVEAATGGVPRPVPGYRMGVRSRWWWGDVDHLIGRLRRTNGARLPDDPGRWRAVRDFLTLWKPGDRNEVLRLDDPWPIVRETVEWLQGR